MSQNEKFDLNLLKVFDAIYKLGTITRAAKHLNVSQPAVSHALARLREIYNDPLFSRSPQRMKPSPIANEIALNIDETLQQTRISLAKAGRFNAATSDRHFKLIMSDAHGAAILPRLVGIITKAAPTMSIEVQKYPRYNAVDNLINGEADFIISHFLPEHPQICKEKIIEEEYACFVDINHPCAKTGLDLEQYLAYQHIHASSRKDGKNYIDMALQALGKSRKISYQTQDYLVTPYALANSELILTSPKYIAINYDFVKLPVPFEIQPISIYLYWHTSRGSDPASLWLRSQKWYS